MTAQEYIKANGRPAPAPLPAVADLLTQITSGLQKLEGKLTFTRDNVVRTQLASALANINGDLADIAKDAKVKANQEQQAKIKVARAALEASAASGA